MTEVKSMQMENIPKLKGESSILSLGSIETKIGAGYVVSVHYDEHNRQIADVKTYGKVNVRKPRKEVERVFPDTRIRRLIRTPHTNIVQV